MCTCSLAHWTRVSTCESSAEKTKTGGFFCISFGRFQLFTYIQSIWIETYWIFGYFMYIYVLKNFGVD